MGWNVVKSANHPFLYFLRQNTGAIVVANFVAIIDLFALFVICSKNSTAGGCA